MAKKARECPLVNFEPPPLFFFCLENKMTEWNARFAFEIRFARRRKRSSNGEFPLLSCSPLLNLLSVNYCLNKIEVVGNTVSRVGKLTSFSCWLLRVYFARKLSKALLFCRVVVKGAYFSFVWLGIIECLINLMTCLGIFSLRCLRCNAYGGLKFGTSSEYRQPYWVLRVYLVYVYGIHKASVYLLSSTSTF